MASMWFDFFFFIKVAILNHVFFFNLCYFSNSFFLYVLLCQTFWSNVMEMKNTQFIIVSFTT